MGDALVARLDVGRGERRAVMGIPVATMAIGKAGAMNAAILAAQILALSDKSVANKLVLLRKKMARNVEEKARVIESL